MANAPDPGPPKELERRQVTLSKITADVEGYPGLELAVDGIEVVVEGVPEHAIPPCKCGHDAGQHFEEQDERGHRFGCHGTDTRPEGDDIVPVQCACAGYEADRAAEVEEVAFRVARIVEVLASGKARLGRVAELER